ncbi:MAG: Hsp20/alpha crystallin family protein [Bradyrhizobiaceae bacterium]|nr:Hsp20/alpha crystallin family protein [Bradyrhizobiaceae bacterium]
MGIIKVDPFRGFEQVSRRVNDVFDQMQRGGFAFEMGDFSPRVDVTEDDKGVMFHAELPGIPKEAVKITVSDDKVLTIRGEKKREEKQEDKNYMRIERRYGSFARSFGLADNLDTDSIKASFDNGVLTVAIAKKEPAKPRELEVTIQ